MTLSLLAQRDEDILKSRERARKTAIARHRQAFRAHLPGQAVWVYGSILTPGKFRPESDIDIALERLPDRRSLDALQSVLIEATGHEVDVCLLAETRLRAKIESHGQRWIEPSTKNKERLHPKRRTKNQERRTSPMPSPTRPTAATADQLWSIAPDGYRYELVSGELRMMSPAGGRHGRIASQIAYLLKRHVDEFRLGVVYAAETGFLIETDPDTVLAPDAGFVSEQRHRTIEDETGYLPLAPDLAVEVISPNDRFSRVETKALAWLDAGTALVLLVDPAEQTVHAYRSRKRIDIYQTEESVDCGDAVPNWQLRIKDIFETC